MLPFSVSAHSLTLCASLVQNPMNLGALCRTAEVFGLRELVLPSLQVATTPEFRRLAVSAHQWQPLTACPVDALPRWLAQQQHQGAQVVALTRHVHAVSLPQFAFPKHTVLLLGRELTGIPAPLLTGCDAIVEIPQSGQVDSLNVATAAAIAAYAYLTQHATS
ncbi:MAG TPA: RNA methyltransferase [Candidatus Obscuribacterales bacterium]